VNGKATIKGSNGDKEICSYVNGVKQGPATYFWKAGHKEDFTYDKAGAKTGPATLVGASGATRKGNKKDGQWHGATTFKSADGETKKERWENGRKVEG